MFYEIINPSDKAMFEADDLRIAALVTFLIGGGQYGAEPEDGEAEGVPIFLFGGNKEWWSAHFDEPMEGAVDRHAAKLVVALRSVCYGDMTDRRLFDSALTAIDDPEKRAAFVAEWNDRHRSSLNDIMGGLTGLRKSSKPAPPAPRTTLGKKLVMTRTLVP